MKFILSILFAFLLSACGNQPQYQQRPAEVVYVQQPDGTSVLMNYLLWKSLMDQGGQTTVNNYYNSHRNDPEFQPQKQQEYKQKYDNQVKTQKSNGFGNRPVTTEKSNGFGKSPSPSKPATNTNSVSTNKSSGFGKPASSPSKPTKTQTTKSSGFGKKN